MTRRAKIFRLAKGFRGRAKNCYKIALNRVEKALQYQYRDRKQRKRDFRSQWITSINAATMESGVKYSQFMHGLAIADIPLNRKVLAELAETEPLSMRALIALSHSARQEHKSSDFVDYYDRIWEWPESWGETGPELPAIIEQQKSKEEKEEEEAKKRASNAKKQAERLAREANKQAEREAEKAERELTRAEML